MLPKRVRPQLQRFLETANWYFLPPSRTFGIDLDTEKAPCRKYAGSIDNESNFLTRQGEPAGQEAIAKSCWIKMESSFAGYLGKLLKILQGQ